MTTPPPGTGFARTSMTRPSGRVRSLVYWLPAAIDQPAHFGFDIDLAVFAMRCEVANVVAKARPRGQQSVGQIEHLLEIAVPRREPLLGVKHRHTVAHVVKGDAQLGLPLADLAEQPRILDRDDRLVGKGAHQLYLPLGERLDPLVVKRDNADRLALVQQRHPKCGPSPGRHSPGKRVVRVSADVRNMHDPAFERHSSLTVIAQKITGAHWSGPRFFGLTKRAPALAGAEASR
jgi:hypothetical protein